MRAATQTQSSDWIDTIVEQVNKQIPERYAVDKGQVQVVVDNIIAQAGSSKYLPAATEQKVRLDALQNLMVLQAVEYVLVQTCRHNSIRRETLLKEEARVVLKCGAAATGSAGRCNWQAALTTIKYIQTVSGLSEHDASLLTRDIIEGSMIPIDQPWGNKWWDRLRALKR